MFSGNISLIYWTIFVHYLCRP